MIRRLYNMFRANLHGFASRQKKDYNYYSEGREFIPDQQGTYGLDPLAGYYANLELQPGASRDQIKQAWKRLLRKYHPDLHSADSEKSKIATELTGRLNKAYRILNKEFLKRG